jgi:MFS family permease
VSVVEPVSVGETAAPSQRSLFAWSWLNFFLSGMQTAFGPVAAAYLAAQEWTARDIGFVLSIGGIASLVSQVPGGELLDAVRAKRLLVATGVLTVALSTLIFRLWPSFPLVALAEVLQGVTGGVLGPAVVAITLGLVGHAALAERLGQNQRFAAAGGVVVTLSIDGYDGHADTGTRSLGLGLGPRRIRAGRVCWRCSSSSRLCVWLLPGLFLWLRLSRLCLRLWVPSLFLRLCCTGERLG